MKPYYETELGVLYHGDCLDIMPHLEPVDLVLTDPPYPNFHTEQYGYFDGIINFLNSLCCRQLIFWTEKEEFPLTHKVVHEWNKLCGTWATKELIYERNSRSEPKKFGYQKIKNKIDAQMNRDVLTIHPSQKPIRLIREMVYLWSEPKSLILDPFAGTGTTFVVCEELNRRWIGIEIEEKYCEIAAKRIEKERQQLKLF